jgi:hypothetical protein
MSDNPKRWFLHRIDLNNPPECIGGLNSLDVYQLYSKVETWISFYDHCPFPSTDPRVLEFDQEQWRHSQKVSLETVTELIVPAEVKGRSVDFDIQMAIGYARIGGDREGEHTAAARGMTPP